MNIEIKGLKKAVGDYQRANADGAYDSRYGYMYLDRITGELWTDEHYDLGHSWQTHYHSPSIINIVSYIAEHKMDVFAVTMAIVKEYAEQSIAEYTFID